MLVLRNFPKSIKGQILKLILAPLNRAYAFCKPSPLGLSSPRIISNIHKLSLQLALARILIVVSAGVLVSISSTFALANSSTDIESKTEVKTNSRLSSRTKPKTKKRAQFSTVLAATSPKPSQIISADKNENQRSNPKLSKIRKTAVLQIFGDLYIPRRVIRETFTDEKSPRLFSKIKRLLDSSIENIANFEGVATNSTMPREIKSFLLKMPVWIGKTLKIAGFNTVSLANNHALDFGEAGLFSSRVSLTNAGIQSFGAGENLSEAIRPAFIKIGQKVGCLLSFSRTLPVSFWAKEKKAGTAFLDYPKTRREIEKCSKLGYFTIVIFHWGQEMTKIPKTYQKELAKLSINAGADLVIGHHPHILQSIEVYKGKPIFYSIGNFAFGSYTIKSAQEGMSVRLGFQSPGGKPVYDLVPINVQNRDVKFIPRLYPKGVITPLDEHIPNRYCKKGYSTNFFGVYFSCKFDL